MIWFPGKRNTNCKKNLILKPNISFFLQKNNVIFKGLFHFCISRKTHNIAIGYLRTVPSSFFSSIYFNLNIFQKYRKDDTCHNNILYKNVNENINHMTRSISSIVNGKKRIRKNKENINKQSIFSRFLSFELYSLYLLS